MIPEGFIPLIEFEEKNNDRLLISFPSTKYRKENIIYSELLNKYWEIISVYDGYNGYRIPQLKEIEL